MKINRYVLIMSFFAIALSGCLEAEKDRVVTEKIIVVTTHLTPKCGGVFGKCGYVDRVTGEQIIELKYQRAFPFSEGLAAVRIRGKYGYINGQGQTVIGPAFSLAGAFNNGLAEVIVADKAGVIDRTGAFRVEPQFARAIPFTDSTIIAAEGTWRQRHLEGYEKLEGLVGNSTSISVALAAGAGLYHLKNGWVTGSKIRFSAFGTGASGLIWAAETERPLYDRNLKYGLMRADGTWQVEPTFSHVQTLNDGLAVVGVKGPDKKERRGAVDRFGNIRVPLNKYDGLSYWNNGYGIAHKNGKKGLLNKKGELVTGKLWDGVERAQQNRLARVRSGDIWMSVTVDGELIDDELDGTIVVKCQDGLIIRRAGNGIRVFNSDGAPVSNTIYDRLYYGNRDCGQPISVKLDGEWGFITQDGLTIPDVPGFENTYAFEGGGAWVQKEGLWGKVDTSGVIVVPFHFEKFQPVGNGHAKVTRNGVEILVNSQGEGVDSVPEDPTVRESWLKCNGGSRLFRKNGKWGLSGPDGETIIPANHDALGCFRNGVNWTPVTSKNAWCPIGTDGKPMREIACKATHYPYYQSHHFPEPLDEDPYRSSVLWFQAHLEWAAGLRNDAPRMIGDGIQSSVSSSISRQ